MDICVIFYTNSLKRDEYNKTKFIIRPVSVFNSYFLGLAKMYLVAFSLRV